MGLFGKIGKGMLNAAGTAAAIGGIALISNIMESEREAVHVYEDRSAEQLRSIEKERHKQWLEKEREKNRQQFPNSIENIKERIKNDNKIEVLLVCGSMIMIYFASSNYPRSENASKTMFVFCIIAAILFLLPLIKIYGVKRKYMQYISLIVVQNERNIGNIANQMGCGYAEAFENVEQIISKGYLKNFTIDKKNKVILEKNKGNNASDVNSQKANYSKTNKPNKCPYCGGNLFVEKNDSIYCGYCGGAMY